MAGPDLADVERTFTRAERCIVRERRQVVDEREAFRAFEQRVRELEPVASASATSAAPGGAVRATGSRSRLDDVRDAYRATVTSVPHYAETYDDTYEQSVAAEFGADLGVALTRGSAFTGPCRRGLLAAARASREGREQFVETLDAEHDSLEAAAEVLVPAASQLRDYAAVDFDDEPSAARDAYRARLEVLGDRCEEVAETRQAVLDDHRGAFSDRLDVADLPRYLYEDLPVTYPVLAVAARLATAVRDRRCDLVRTR